MSDDSLKEVLEGHFNRLEEVVGTIKTQTRSTWQFRLGDLTAILAVAGLVITISQSWAVTEKRVQQLEQTEAKNSSQTERVNKIEWSLAQTNQDIGSLRADVGSMRGQVQEMHDALLKLGMFLGKGNK